MVSGGCYANAITSYSDVIFKVNGTNVSFDRTEDVTGGLALHTSSAGVLQLAAGDYVELWHDNSAGDTTWEFNTGVTGGNWISVIKVGSGTLGESIGAVVRNSTTQSIATGTPDGLTFDEEDYDTDGFHSTSVNTERLTIPTGLGGKYLVWGKTYIAAHATGTRIANIYKGGAAYELADQRKPDGTNVDVLRFSSVMDLNAGDYIEFFVTQDSGGALNFGSATDSANSIFGLTLLATQMPTDLRTGTAFPASPSTGDRYRRSDIDYMVFFYDGTQWVSENLFHAGISLDGITVDTKERLPIRTDYKIKAQRFEALMRLSGASSTWVVKLQTIDFENDAVDMTSCSASLTTGTYTVNNVYSDYGADLTQVIDLTGGDSADSIRAIQMFADEQAGTSSLNVGISFYYRLIAT
jgi:hypothetical protein